MPLAGLWARSPSAQFHGQELEQARLQRRTTPVTAGKQDMIHLYEAFNASQQAGVSAPAKRSIGFSSANREN